MAHQQTDINESIRKSKNKGADQKQTNKANSLQNGTDTQQGGRNSKSCPIMGGEKTKSPASGAAGGNGGQAPASPASGPPHPSHPGSENAPGMHPYESSGHHMPPSGNAGPSDPSTNNKDDMHHHPQHHPMHQQHPQHHQHQMYGQPPMQHQQYPRYHHDPNMPPGGPDPYAHYRMGAAPSGKPGSMIPPNRPPPQRYMQGPGPGQPPQHPGHPGQQQTQGPTPTLNSLLQSHPPPPPHSQHRYPNSYDPNPAQQPPPPGPGQSPGPQPGQQQQPSQQQQPQQPPSSGQPPQPYGGHQQGWAPPPRPYSPQHQMGSQQSYRPPPPGSNARGQSPYPPGAPGQSPGSYPPPSQQQGGGPQSQPGQQAGQQQPPGRVDQGGPPPPPQGHQPPGQPPQASPGQPGSGPPPSGPYQQRYPTPPGPNAGPNHRSPYPPHQYEPVRSWPSPAASPGPGGQQQTHLPPSPHGPPQSPGHHGSGPSPSPQPPQPAQSPHQDSTGQNSNDSSSGGATGGASAAPGTPNSQGMRPSPSPTGSSGSRSMSPAVGQQSLPMPPRPSSSHSQVPNQAQNQLGSSSSNLGHGNQSQQQQPPDHSRVASPNRPPSASSAGGPQQQQQGPLPPQAGMAAQGYQTQPPHPPHMHGGYKMGPSPGGPGAGMPGPQQMSPYPPHNPQSQQYSHSQGSYSPRPQYPGGYGPTPPGGQPGQPPPPGPPPNSVAGGPGGYPGHRMPNHVGGPPPHSQYPPHQPYQQGWGPPGPGPQGPGGHVNNHQQQPGKGMPPTGVPPSPQSNQAQSQQGPPTGGPPQSGSPRPLNYLKQHLQHKGGYGGAPSPTPPQGYGNGPGMHPPMGPPHHMGPPMGPTSMGPPSGTPPNQQGPPGPPGGPPQQQHTPPQSGPNSHPDGSLPPQPPHPESGPLGQDNGGLPHPVTSLVTTGPDGAPLDEASQQSTLSNTSVASGEDPQCSTPKSRKGDLYNQSHLTSTPTTASPGPHNQHEDFEMNSPTSWPRPPASPVFNSHVPPAETPFRSTKKSDSLNKLYDMDDKPERRPWLDKLLAFMEERRTPITACPTISKTPLDLYKLYILTQERGGFLEVCKVTKSKTWKDIAGLLGIGASSSAAYTLRKHYTKNLLPFECKFDRGGIDPAPIIAQVEAGSKKKSNKTASVPSPGSSNSQDSFPAPGSSSASMDGYGAYPGGAAAGGYPPGVNPEYAQQGQQSGPGQQPPTGAPGQQPPAQQNLQRPPSQQSGTQSPHPGSAPPTTGDNISVSNPFDDPVGPQRPPYQQGAPYPPASRPQGAPYPGQPGGYQYGAPDQYGQGQPGQYPPGQQGQYPPASRPMYPPYGPPESGEGRSTPPAPGSAPPATADPYRGYGSGPYPPPPQQRPYGQQPPPGSSGPSQTPPAGPPGAASQPPVSGAPGQQPPAGQGQGYPATPQQPPQSDYYRPDQPNQPRRHPDFEKNQQPYPPYQQRPQMYPGGWQGGAGQYRGQYPPQGPQQQWGTHNGPRPSGPPGAPAGPPGAPGTPNQWNAEPNRYPPNQQPPYPPHQQNQQQPWNQMPPTSQGSPLRPPQRGGKPFSSMQQAGMSSSMPPAAQPPAPAGAPPGAAPVVPGPTVGSAPPVAPQAAPQPVGATVKPAPQAPFPPASTVAPKRDIVFPPDSIESTAPVQYKRKRINKLDIGQTDPWRIFMALRSGLLVESTWALDVLNILLFDDSSVGYFGLTHLPGLLNLLLDHFQKSLSDMFETTDRKKLAYGKAYGWFGKDTEESEEDEEDEELDEERRAFEEAMQIKQEVGDIKIENGETEEQDGLKRSCRRERKREQRKSRKASELDLGSVIDLPNPDDRIVVFNSTTNYTMSSRKGLPVKIQPAEDDVFVLNHRKEWDRTADDRYHRETDVGGDPWTAGHSEPDPHDYIMETFQAEFVNIPFARLIRTSRKYKMRCKSNNNNNNSSSNNNNRSNSPLKRKNAEDEQSDSEKCNRTNGENRIVNGETTEAEEDSKPSVDSFVVKKEVPEVTPSSDADCREIDMELEKSSLSNGPQEGPTAEESDCKEDVKMEIEEEKLDEEEVTEKKFNVAATIEDPAKVLKRRRMSDYEDECYTRDEASLYLVTEGHDALARRCVAISNILRNLTFVPNNENEFARSSRFLSILGKILLLHHEHPVRTKKTRNYDREEDADFSDSCSSLQGESEWWWDFLVQIRENMLVSMANIAGQLDLSLFEEPISRPILDGLLHWSVCPSAHGQDPFPTLGTNSVLSPQRLALEALCKLCVTDSNVDLVIATPPYTRLEKLCSVLTRHLCKNEDQVLREFSVNLLHYLAAADSATARTIALQSPCVSYLVAFIEQAEQTALGVANQHGINYLRDNPDSMGTSLDMLRRAAGTLLHLAKHPDNRPLFLQQEQRLLGLVMSHILDQQVALIISRVLFQCSRGTGPLTTMEIESCLSSSKSDSKKASEKEPSEASKSSMHLNSIIANNSSPSNCSSNSHSATSMGAPPAPAALPSLSSTPTKSTEQFTSLMSPQSASLSSATMPAPSAPVSNNGGPPAFVPPPGSPSSPAANNGSSSSEVVSPPPPPAPQHPITASS